MCRRRAWTVVIAAGLSLAAYAGCSGSVETSSGGGGSGGSRDDDASVGGAGGGAGGVDASTGGGGTSGDSAAGTGGAGGEGPRDSGVDVQPPLCSGRAELVSERVPRSHRFAVEGRVAFVLSNELHEISLASGAIRRLWQSDSGLSYALVADESAAFWAYQPSDNLDTLFWQTIWTADDAGPRELRRLEAIQYWSLALGENYLYVEWSWTDIWGSIAGVSRIPRTGGAEEVMYSGEPVASLRLDGTYLYWLTQAGLWRTPTTANKEDAPEPVIATSTVPSNLAIGVGWAFWTEREATSLLRLKLGSTKAEPLATAQAPKRLETDGTEVFWLEQPLDGAAALKKVSASGGDPVTISDDPGLVNFDIDEHCVYWMTWSEGDEHASLWRRMK
jgi:hypothetical protein